ncbi:hypothetical protein THAOC_32794 [Thalassiosira oceanica]|uniref:Uncharacterized protein n=1 Tax=Thalassiosira oceanica TaxID=159749 RepID=K0R574_THAOC|nr:hypothetical protein THAOC_32794 [Thalassiosira oceanica]|eukprot:EJK48408.1 hypothetical protein THAOC_32794 [Thalassiosira oceanica]
MVDKSWIPGPRARDGGPHDDQWHGDGGCGWGTALQPSGNADSPPVRGGLAALMWRRIARTLADDAARGPRRQGGQGGRSAAARDLRACAASSLQSPGRGGGSRWDAGDAGRRPAGGKDQHFRGELELYAVGRNRRLVNQNATGGAPSAKGGAPRPTWPRRLHGREADDLARPVELLTEGRRATRSGTLQGSGDGQSWGRAWQCSNGAFRDSQLGFVALR